MQFVYDPGVYAENRYQFLTATGGVAGAFDTVSGTAPQSDSQTVIYGANEADLVLSGISVTENAAILGSESSTFSATDFADDDLVFSHLDEQQFGAGADAVKTALAGAAPTQLAFNGQLAQLGPVGSQLPRAIAEDGGWVRAMGDFFSAHGQGAAPGYSSTGGGLLAGLDRHWFNRLTLGVAGGYSRSDLSQKDGTSGTIDTPRVMAYARYEPAPRVVIDGLTGFAFDRIHTERPVAVLGTKAVESHNGYEENFALQAGYILPWQSVSIVPRLGVQYAHLSEAGYSESGASGFDMIAPASHIDSFQPIFSVSALDTFTTDSGMQIVPEMKLAYSRELLSTNRNLVLTTASGSLAPSQALSPAHNTITVGPELSLAMTERLDFYADYSLAIGIGKSLAHTVFAGVRWAF